MGDELEAVRNSYFTAEISNRMRVPDRITLTGNSHGAGPSAQSEPNLNGQFKTAASANYHHTMTVPDRIVVAGGNTHIASKAPPRELQLENSVLPPTLDQVRVSTPPRSIRLDHHVFPSAAESGRDVDTGEGNSEEEDAINLVGGIARRGPVKGDHALSPLSAGQIHRDDSSSELALRPDHLIRNNLSTSEEIQLVRRQIAKLNHRLMAVELENQQQQQRETILTIIVSVYFIGKILLWMRRSW